MKFYPKVHAVGGEADLTTVYVNDSGTWRKLESWSNIKVVKKLNQMSEFEVNLFDIESSEKLYIKKKAEILFFVGNTLLLKGIIQRVEYSTAYDCKVLGNGMEIELLEKEYENATRNATEPKRIGYSDVSAQTIAKELLSENSDAASPWIINPGTIGLFVTDYGNLSVKYEYTNRLNCLVSLADAIDYEWWISQSKDYATDYFNITTRKGSSTSVKTFEISGANQNAIRTSKETDMENVINKTSILGRGDGINQLRTSTYNASATYTTTNFSDTKLNGSITDSATTITVDSTDTFPSSGTILIESEQITYTGTTSTTFTGCTRGANGTTATAHNDNISVLQYSEIILSNASSFPSSETVRIAEEQIDYTGKSSNTLTGITRGANSTTAKEHKKGCYIEKYVSYTSAEAGSSIGDNGLIDKTYIDKTLQDEPTAELVASRILLEKKDPITRIKVIPDDPVDILEDTVIGDTVTVNDAESGITSTNYRIVGLTFTDEYGNYNLELELSNRSLEFVEQMTEMKEKEENISKYMQGATNIYAISNYENCDNSKPLNMRFYIPSEAIAINKVLLKFATHKFRGYTSTSKVNSENSSAVSAASIANSINLTSNTWTELLEATINADSDGISFKLEMDVCNTATSDPTGSSGGFLFRIYDGSNYWPTSNGMHFIGGYANNTIPSMMSGFVNYFIPGNPNGKTYSVQVRWDGFSNNVDWSINYDLEYMGFTRHTHPMKYGIYEDSFPTNAGLTIKAGTEGSESTVDTISVSDGGTYSYDITDEIDDVGAGNWANIKFTPSGTSHTRMRVEANCYVQIFIESKY